MAERLDSVPESYCSDDDLQDDLDYYYVGASDGEVERGEEELNELAANVDPEYYEFKCLTQRSDVEGYLDTQAEKLVATLRGKCAVSAAGGGQPCTARPTASERALFCGLFTSGTWFG